MVTAFFHKSEIKLAWKGQMKQLLVTGNTITKKGRKSINSVFMEMNASQSENRDPVNTITSPTGFQYSFSPLLTPSECSVIV